MKLYSFKQHRHFGPSMIKVSLRTSYIWCALCVLMFVGFHVLDNLLTHHNRRENHNSNGFVHRMASFRNLKVFN